MFFFLTEQNVFKAETVIFKPMDLSIYDVMVLY